MRIQDKTFGIAGGCAPPGRGLPIYNKVEYVDMRPRQKSRWQLGRDRPSRPFTKQTICRTDEDICSSFNHTGM